MLCASHMRLVEIVELIHTSCRLEIPEPDSPYVFVLPPATPTAPDGEAGHTDTTTTNAGVRTLTDEERSQAACYANTIPFFVLGHHLDAYRGVSVFERVAEEEMASLNDERSWCRTVWDHEASQLADELHFTVQGFDPSHLPEKWDKDQDSVILKHLTAMVDSAAVARSMDNNTGPLPQPGFVYNSHHAGRITIALVLEQLIMQGNGAVAPYESPRFPK